MCVGIVSFALSTIKYMLRYFLLTVCSYCTLVILQERRFAQYADTSMKRSWNSRDMHTHLIEYFLLTLKYQCFILLKWNIVISKTVDSCEIIYGLSSRTVHSMQFIHSFIISLFDWFGFWIFSCKLTRPVPPEEAT